MLARVGAPPSGEAGAAGTQSQCEQAAHSNAQRAPENEEVPGIGTGCSLVQPPAQAVCSPAQACMGFYPPHQCQTVASQVHEARRIACRQQVLAFMERVSNICPVCPGTAGHSAPGRSEGAATAWQVATCQPQSALAVRGGGGNILVWQVRCGLEGLPSYS